MHAKRLNYFDCSARVLCRESKAIGAVARKPARMGWAYRPSSWTSQVDKNDCYTLSCVGVTHYINGKAEFIGIEQWKREHFLFKAIIRIPIFKMCATLGVPIEP